MTKQELKDRLVRIRKCGYGQWLVTFKVRGKDVTIYTTDSIYIDAIQSDEPCCGYTPKQALEALWCRCRQS